MGISNQDRVQLFNRWAINYDLSVQAADGFPFAGYQQVLDELAMLAKVEADMNILDLGIGTGNLAERFYHLGVLIWGIDFSQEMLKQVQAKLPLARLVQADLLGKWPVEFQQRFDRILSTYVFHEFDLMTKINLLVRLADQHLVKDGYILIGDIAFPSQQVLEQAREHWLNRWDETEHYWVADEMIMACEQAGLHVNYKQVSSCGGIFVIKGDQLLQTFQK
jgi:putative AdoMet-dependent methyltransferase